MHLLSLFFLSFLSLSLSSQADQTVMDTNQSPDSYPVPQTNRNSMPTLADLLTIEPSTSIFYSYAREVQLSELFVDENARNTLLVPTNAAVMALARKPHQGPELIDDEVGTSEQEFDTISKRNVERWISAHIIPQSPITLESRTYPTLLCGKSVSFKRLDDHGGAHGPEWSRVVLDDGIHIVKMKEGLNGVLYVIDGTIKVD